MHTIFHIMTIYLPSLHVFDEVYILKDYFSDRNVLHLNIGLHERKLHEMKFHYQLFLIIILSMCILVFFVRQIMFLRKFSYQTYGLNASKRITTHLGYRCNLLTSTIWGHYGRVEKQGTLSDQLWHHRKVLPNKAKKEEHTWWAKKVPW